MVALLCLMHYWRSSNVPAILYYSFPRKAILLRDFGLSHDISYKSGNACALNQSDIGGIKVHTGTRRGAPDFIFFVTERCEKWFERNNVFDFKEMYSYMFEVDISMSHTNALFSDLFCSSDLTFPVVRVWTALGYGLAYDYYKIILQ